MDEVAWALVWPGLVLGALAGLEAMVDYLKGKRMDWLKFVSRVFVLINSDPALKALAAEIWAWILEKLVPKPGMQSAAATADPDALVAGFKTSKGI